MTDPQIRQIHLSGWAGVLVATGGGATAISRLLSVPGGSRSMLSAAIPYASSALIEWLGRRPDSFCAEETALAMATVACQKAKQLALAESRSEKMFGLACTASLASDRPKRGPHRAFLALHSAQFTRTISLLLDKGARNRGQEEQLVSDLILNLLAESCGVGRDETIILRDNDQLEDRRAIAYPLLVQLLESQQSVIWSHPDGRLDAVLPAALWPEPEIDLQCQLPRRGVLCGSFHPLHEGHSRLRDVAAKKLGGPVYYELSILNVDKPPLDFLSIEDRRRQFTREPMALTCAPRFATKSAALPRTTFVVGVDTAARIVDPRYYNGSEVDRDRALQTIRENGCGFLVAGRVSDVEGFMTLRELPIPESFRQLFQPITEDEFRLDISSTELRRQQQLAE